MQGLEASTLRPQCPLWVTSGHFAMRERCPLYPRKRTFALQLEMSALGQKRSRRVRPFIEKRYRRDVEHARARAFYRFRSGLLAGPAIQNNKPDHGCDHQRATESRCQCPVIYCRDLHVCRLGGAAKAICEVDHKATGNFADPRRGSGIVMSLRGPGLTYQSALPPKADMCVALAYVCFGPKADIAPAVRRNERDTNRACKRPRRTHIQLE
jgi:hypothetical protein